MVKGKPVYGLRESFPSRAGGTSAHRREFVRDYRTSDRGIPYRSRLRTELLRFRAFQFALVRPFLRSDVDLPGTRDLLLLVEQHLLPLRQPAGHAADGEQNGEEVGREGHRTVDEAGVEVDVRIELSRGEVVV